MVADSLHIKYTVFDVGGLAVIELFYYIYIEKDEEEIIIFFTYDLLYIV